MADSVAIHLEALENINKRDLAAFRAMLHPDYTYTGPDGVELKGPEAGIAEVEGILAGFPDVRLTVNHHHQCGDVSVIEFIARGTHTGPLGPIPATGKSAEVVVCDIVDIRDGKIYREREYYDQLTMMQQLGVIPAE